MTDKELKNLSRRDLLEMLIEQSKELQRLREKLAETEALLEKKEISISNVGSIAEAALQLNGVFEAAQEKGFYAIGVDKDQKSENPDVVVCSMLKHVGESVYQAVAQYIEEGVFNGGEIWDADLSTGLVGIGYGDDSMPQQVSDELKAEVDALAQKIIDGEIVVDTTR